MQLAEFILHYEDILELIYFTYIYSFNSQITFSQFCKFAYSERY